MTTVNIYGLGYIGLPTASLLAMNGYDVLGIDVTQSVVDTINQGKIHIVEPDLDVLVRSAVNVGKLRAALIPEKAAVHIIAVPTPFKEGKQPDISYVKAATLAICDVLEENNLIILESTSPVGTTEEIQKWVSQNRPELQQIFIAHSPERVIPGKVLQELINNDRVIGGIDQASTEKAVAFYQTIVDGEVIPTTARTAELCKLTENSFRDVNIAFANELSLICDELDVDVWELIKLANRHPRVDILQPGPGVGGHCIAVDPWFIVAAVPEQAKLIHAARKINDQKPKWVIEQVKAAAFKEEKPVIACLGISFKADIDDLRESPSLNIVKELQTQNIGEILIVEPNIENHQTLSLTALDDALKRANIVLLLVDHKEFKEIRLKDLEGKAVIDTRGILKE